VYIGSFSIRLHQIPAKILELLSDSEKEALESWMRDRRNGCPTARQNLPWPSRQPATLPEVVDAMRAIADLVTTSPILPHEVLHWVMGRSILDRAFTMRGIPVLRHRRITTKFVLKPCG
jgi:hypothetical protein